MRARPLAFHSDDLTLPGGIVVPDRPRALLVLCRGIPSGHADPSDPGYEGFGHDLADAGYAACWFLFRGCYDAPGDYSALGWSADLGAVLDSLAAREDVGALPRLLVGSSAGGGAAIAVGSRRDDVAGVAAFAAVSSWSFDGAPRDHRHLVQRLRNAGLIRDPAFPRDAAAWDAEFDQEAAEKHVGALSPRPLLLIHGDADQVVPYPHAERLFSLAGPPKELVRIPGGAHQLRRDPLAVEALLDWLDRML